MNRKLLIIGGVILILIVLGIWVYLMLYGVPKSSDEVFANLGFQSGPIDTSLPTPEEPAPTTNINTEPAPVEALTQLTIRPTVGAHLLEEQGIYYARYVEAGTGHVYEINLESMNESRISGTTFTQITNAVFAPDGSAVALIQNGVAATETTLGLINSDRTGEESVTTIELPLDIQNLTFSEDSKAVRFTVSDFTSTRGYQQKIGADIPELLFTIPLSDITMIWDRDEDFFVHTKPASALDGYVYRLNGSELTRVTTGGRGLTALISDSTIITAYYTDDEQENTLINLETKTVGSLPISVLPEKCTFTKEGINIVWCTVPTEIVSGELQDDWYLGKTSFTDRLWKVDVTNQSATLRSNFNTESGRTIDGVSVTQKGPYVLFINRLDAVLWLFNDQVWVFTTSVSIS